MHSLFATGGYTLSENWWAFRPRRPGTYPGIVLMHGAGGEEFGFSEFYNPTAFAVVKQIVEAGYFALSPDGSSTVAPTGAHTWAHDESTDSFHNSVAYAQAHLGMAPGQVLVLGASMGCVSAFNYKRRWPTEVAGLLIAPGAFNVDGYHHTAENPGIGKYVNEINTAYGGLANWNAAKATHDPFLFIAAPSDWGPVMMHHCSDDPVSPVSYVQTVANRIGADLTLYPTGGHGGTFSQMNVPDVLSFLASCIEPGVPG